MDRLFGKADLAAMGRLRGVFNPDGRLGQGKVLPSSDGLAIQRTSPGRRATA